MFTKKTKIFLLLIAMLSVIAFTACGGGSGGGGGAPSGGSGDSGGGDGGGGGNGGGATTVTDIDGNVYNTVTIGTQVWMKENLKVTKYRNGDAIGTTTNDISGETAPKYQWAYNGDENNVAVYGRLYTWYAATDNRGLCPTGWHVPTDAEWTLLTDYLGTNAGGKMKEAGTTHWTTPNTGATNSSGFTALPGGYRGLDMTFFYIGLDGRWWSATGGSAEGAWVRYLYYDYGDADRSNDYKFVGFSVRCIKDSDAVVIDIDNNVYNTVTIGSQVWMKENLKVTRYRNGDTIGDTGQWAYNNDENNVPVYGRLYTWYAATDNRGLCPTGWHLPTDAEWTTLTTFLGGVDVAGGHMKEAGTSHWASPNPSDNSSGWTALPGGYRDLNGSFYSIGFYGSWWSATNYDATNAWRRYLSYDIINATRSNISEGYGFSVRCIKEATVTDIDGNVYNTVTIGSQVWMKENLKVTRYNNGDDIGTTTPATLDISGEGSPKYQWAYDGNESNVADYGRLYTWYAATDSRGLCPTGWHVPGNISWTALTDYLGTDAGGKMKEAGFAHWVSSDTGGADNSSGFTALPGGRRSFNGFSTIGFSGYWWSATEYDADATYAWYLDLYYRSTGASQTNFTKLIGNSVRCIKNAVLT